MRKGSAIIAAAAMTTVLVHANTAQAAKPRMSGRESASLLSPRPLPSDDQREQILPVGAFETVGDNVHLSSSQPWATSAHGWWRMISGPRGVKAKVTVYLQAQDVHGSWITVSTRSKVVYSDGGSANRAVAQKQCTNLIQRVLWRSLIDVDLIGINDPPDITTTSSLPYYCGAGV